jgi:alkylated DNA repair dioxygenase AlkB
VSEQFALFETTAALSDGLRSAVDFASSEIEQQLVSKIRDLPLEPFQFGQFEGRRRVASFGFRYDYALRQLQQSEPIPAWLDEIVTKIEAFGGPDTRIQQVLCTEYDVGVGIGWHRDKPHFDGFSAFRLDPPVNCGSANLPASLGTGSRWMPIRARST